jgi:hypothetical protein
MFGNTWGWVPGPVAQTQVAYAPALVGFVGGGGFGVTVAFGAGAGVAWFPLGPRDVYVPPYQVSQRYVEQINISNTRVINQTTITNVYNSYTVNHVTNVNYTYASNARAIMAVNQQAFVGGMPVAKEAIRVNSEEIQHPRVVTTAALTPTRASIVGAVAAAHAVPPKTLESRRVVTKLPPAPQATPLGKPRPQVNPNLSASAVNRAGFSQQAQTMRAAAAAKAETAPAANRPAPGAQPNRPASNGPRPNEARPNESQPNRPATPPNETRPSQPRPNETRPNEAQPNERPTQPRTEPTPEGRPNRPATPPNETRRPETQPSRPPTPNEERRSQTERPVTPRPQERPATPPKQQQNPSKEQSKPSEKPKEKPKESEPQPRSQL